MSANTDIVRTFYEAFGRGDIPAAFATLRADVEFHEARSLPWGRIYRGLAGMQEFLGELVKVFGQDIRITTHYYVDAPDDQVIVSADLHVLERVFPYLETWQIRDGKVKRIEPFLDTGALLARVREAGRL